VGASPLETRAGAYLGAFEGAAMGSFLIAVVAALASGLVLLAVLGRYREAECLADWEEMLTPAGRQRFEELRERFARELAASQFTYQRAKAASDRGEYDLATRLLEAGHEYVATLAPDRERLVRELSRYTRMLSAVAPLPPLRPAQFELPELATLAGLGSLVHPFLVTAPERLRLRLSILRRGQAIVLRALPRGGQSGSRLGATDWQRVDAARADWSTLDRESLTSFGSLVTALQTP
jgi:hypothetical protein